ncbi:MAG TPA: hypothetical protein VK507_20515 [Iamia sp.]|nr:hypothetical protein [Iamia sp.]
MAELSVRRSAEDGTIDLVGPAPGPAGVVVVETATTRVVVDTAQPDTVVRARIVADPEPDADGRALLAALTGPAPADAVTRLRRLAVRADVVAVDHLAPAARAVATLDLGAAALAATDLLPSLGDTARAALWEVAADPDSPAVLDRAGPARRAAAVALVARVLDRTGDAALDVALRDLRSRWDDRRPALTEDAAAGGAPPLPAAAAPAPGAAAMAGGALARRASAEGAPAPSGPTISRVGDEIRITVPPATGPDTWVRVALRADRVLLGAAPVRVARAGVVRLPLPAAVPTAALLVDLVADPAAPIRDDRGQAVADAVGAGRDAVAAERRSRSGEAAAAWARCATAWDQAGDAARATAARHRASRPAPPDPLAHEI